MRSLAEILSLVEAAAERDAQEEVPLTLSAAEWVVILNRLRDRRQWIHKAKRNREIYEARSAGASWDELAVTHGISVGAVIVAAKQHAKGSSLPWPVETPKRNHAALRVEEMADKVVAGMSQGDVAREYGISRQRVQQLVGPILSSRGLPNGFELARQRRVALAHARDERIYLKVVESGVEATSRELGISSMRAYDAVKRHSARKGLPQPVSSPPLIQRSRNKVEHEAKLMSMYMDYANGMTAKDVAEKYGYKSRAGMTQFLRRWAIQNDLEWPVKRDPITGTRKEDK